MSKKCPDCDRESLEPGLEENPEDYFCYNCGGLFQENEVEE